MNQVNLLRRTLKPFVKWHGARLSFLALFLIALLRVKTVNSAELATGFRSNVKTDSSAGLLPHRLRRRLERIRVRKGNARFFKDFELDYSAIAKTIVALMEIPQPWVLSIDRTIAYGAELRSADNAQGIGESLLCQRSCRIGVADWSFGKTRFNILMLGIPSRSLTSDTYYPHSAEKFNCFLSGSKGLEQFVLDWLISFK